MPTCTELKPLLAGLKPSDYREAILRIEQMMLTLPPMDLPVTHHFAPGMYMRELFIPAGSTLTGKIHKYDHFCLVLKGDIEILDQDGYQRITGPARFTSKAGAKRFGLAHEDTIFITVHPTDAQDVETCERDLVCNDFETYQRFWVEHHSELDRLDFQAFLTEHPQKALHTNAQDFVNTDIDRVELKPSAIDGLGVFSKIRIEPDILILPAHYDGQMTFGGRYINHSKVPNCLLWRDSTDNVWVISRYTLFPGDELTIDYREAVSFDESMRFLT
jgi:hypothetical protein